MADKELTSVRAIIVDKHQRVLLERLTSGPDTGKLALIGEKSEFQTPPEDEIRQCVLEKTGFEFTSFNHFTTRVESASVSGSERTVHCYDGEINGDPKNTSGKNWMDYFAEEEINQLGDQEIIPNHRQVLTTYFAGRKGL